MPGKMEIKVEQPIVSVIVPCYNYAHYLSETLQCLLDQTYKNWECIIVDDGSTDNTKDIATTFTGSDSRFRYFFQSNKGLSTARNTGIKNAKGLYIQLLDADDLISATKFENQVAHLQKHPECDIIYGDYQLMTVDKTKYWQQENVNWIEMRHEPFTEFLCYWEKGFTIPIHAYLFKKTCFEQWGYFDPEIPTHEDLALHLNFSLKGANYFLLKNIVATYRVHASSMAKSLTNMHFGYLLTLRKLLNQKLSFPQRCLVIDRYFEEFSRTVLYKITGRNIILLKSIQVPEGNIINFFSWWLCPLYLIARGIVWLSKTRR